MSTETNQTGSTLNRRKFITLAGIATAVGLTPVKVLAAENSAPVVEPVTTPSHRAPLPVSGNTMADIIEEKIICAEPGKLFLQQEGVIDINGHPTNNKKILEPNRYMGWPTILKTREGRLMVVVSGDRDSHVCPYGKTQVVTSDDNGKTWSAPEIINNTPLDDRDAGLIQTKKGTLVVSWFTSLVFASPAYVTAYNKYARIGEKIPAETKKQWLGNWTRRSEDNGKTWLEPVRTEGTAPHGPIALKNGDLLYVGIGKWEGKTTVIVERSTDDGKSWKLITAIPEMPGLVTSLSEPHVVELKSGKLLAMIRSEPKDRTQCFLLQSESLDGGKTWSPMKSTGIWGYPPHLKQLSNGWLLVVYGVRRIPYGERACISKDEGATWEIKDEINLSNGPSTDLGYPSSTQLDDGSILTVYYQPAKFGEPTCLMTTHWKLKA